MEPSVSCIWLFPLCGVFLNANHSIRSLHHQWCQQQRRWLQWCWLETQSSKNLTIDFINPTITCIRYFTINFAGKVNQIIPVLMPTCHSLMLNIRFYPHGEELSMLHYRCCAPHHLFIYFHNFPGNIYLEKRQTNTLPAFWKIDRTAGNLYQISLASTKHQNCTTPYISSQVHFIAADTCAY